nr:DUF3880 domain-containing protein [Butyrivibrio sp.]
MSKRFGMVYFDNFTNEDFVWGLLLLGREAEIIDTSILRESCSTEDKDALVVALKEKMIDVAVSFNFSPALSDACVELGIPYIGWSFDAPIQTLYEEQVKNDCNYIFTFDKEQLQQVKDCGAKNAYYMPLSSNTYRNRNLEITAADKERFGCDVSFIGSLYSVSSYDDAIKAVSEGTALEMERACEEIFGRWAPDRKVYGRLSDAALSDIAKYYANNTAMDDDALYTTALLTRHIAYMERYEMLKRLTGLGVDLRFHSSDAVTDIPGLVTQGRLDYIEELPKAYKFSRINMNITIPGITSGVPLRVFDIMGMGGFCLTNYQPEVEDLFTPGKDIEVYHDFDEMEEKIRFYLENESKRFQIARAAGETIQRNYTVEKQVSKILSIV